MILEIIAWVATLGVAFSYLLVTHVKRPIIFDCTNMVASVILAPINIFFGVVFAAFLNVFFVAVGAYALFLYYEIVSSVKQGLDLTALPDEELEEYNDLLSHYVGR